MKRIRQLLRSPWLWLAAFAIWFATLWVLSSEARHFPAGLDFKFSDKLIHFCYFFGGGLVAAAFFFRLQPATPNWRRILLLAILAAGLTGALDEYHQSFVFGRSGNDLPDFIADLLGSIVGAFTLKAARRLLS
ncbi:VanZ family protein [Luteolibacter sp. GHJ8]|uniref:VanZ family protein n=1 Tax=Luteolibacter rhizosphaerae TaxID=2989719 RepID=A0ABT3G2W6_9BACT|nr:VanZ family protein [Luteolibacter rhizosphaerae]MCW1913884.1 VanZ family protein [Luteolibacter rhizosphaerae]